MALIGRRAAYSLMTTMVLSVEPPSTITISSGWRVCARNESSTPRIDSPSLSTVRIRLTRLLWVLDLEPLFDIGFLWSGQSMVFAAHVPSG